MFNPLRLASISIVLLSAGCAHNYGRSVYGTVGGYSMNNVHATPPSLMVAHKIERPLYIVLDPNKVKDTWSLATAPCEKGNGPGCERFKLMDFHQFIRRDLRAAMTGYFSRVEVVDSAPTLPGTPHVVADIKVDQIRLNALVRGALTYELIEMTWAFAMRASDQNDYAYSFAGTATSNDSYPTFEAGCAQLIENAIPAMLKKWTEDGGIAALRDKSN
jgi:hypothetical protein